MYVPPGYVSSKEPVAFSILIGEFKALPILLACIQTVPKSDESGNKILDSRLTISSFRTLTSYLQLPNMLIKASVSVWYE